MHSFVRDELPTSFKQHFTYINDKHGHGTRGANLQLLDMPRTSTRAYGTLSIKTQCIQDWNNLKRLFSQTNLHELSRYSLKSLITKKLINYY